MQLYCTWCESPVVQQPSNQVWASSVLQKHPTTQAQRCMCDKGSGCVWSGIRSRKRPRTTIPLCHNLFGTATTAAAVPRLTVCPHPAPDPAASSAGCVPCCCLELPQPLPPVLHVPVHKGLQDHTQTHSTQSQLNLACLSLMQCRVSSRQCLTEAEVHKLAPATKHEVYIADRPTLQHPANHRAGNSQIHTHMQP